MSTNKPISLKTLLSQRGSGLERLVAKAAASDPLTRLVLDLVPTDLARHLVSAGTRNETLVLIVDSAAWAPRFRFLDNEIRAGLSGHGLALAKLLVKVRPGRAD